MSRSASGGTGRPLAMSANCSVPPGRKHAADLAEHGALVGAEVDHAVRDDDVGPPVVDRDGFGESVAELDVRESEGAGGVARLARASRASCRHRRRDPSRRPESAATNESKPAPEPRSTTRSPGCEASQRERVADTGERLDGAVGQARRRPRRRSRAAPRAVGRCGSETSACGLDRDLPVLLAHLLPQRLGRPADPRSSRNLLRRPRPRARRASIPETRPRADARGRRAAATFGPHRRRTRRTVRGSTPRSRRPSGASRRSLAHLVGRQRPRTGNVTGRRTRLCGRTSMTTTSRRRSRRRKLVSGDRLDVAPVAEVRGREPFDPGDVFGGHVAQRRPQLADPLAAPARRTRAFPRGDSTTGRRGSAPAGDATCWRRSGRSRRRCRRPTARPARARRRSRPVDRSPAPWRPRRTRRTGRPWLHDRSLAAILSARAARLSSIQTIT